jgi:2-dehydropantoate 2-reductase
MRVAIVGGGAIGTLIGAHLCQNTAISIIDRGERLANLKDHGLRLIQLDGETIQREPELVTDSFKAAGPQDYVLLAVKAYDLPEVAKTIGYLIDDDTSVVTLQNGIPWWYFQRHPGRYEGLRLESVDPQDNLGKAIDPARIIGCVVYPAAEVLIDGSVRHVEGIRFPVGELDGVERDRTTTLVRMFQDAGFKSRTIPDIRAELWLKAWGALSINPISALTGGKMDEICSHALTKDLVETMMKEAQGVAQCLGISFRHTIEKRIEGARAVGPHKTSMLCDLEAGRRMETEALIGAVVELAEITQQPAPAIKAVHACITLLGEKSTGRA